MVTWPERIGSIFLTCCVTCARARTHTHTHTHIHPFQVSAPPQHHKHGYLSAQPVHTPFSAHVHPCPSHARLGRSLCLDSRPPPHPALVPQRSEYKNLMEDLALPLLPSSSLSRSTRMGSESLQSQLLGSLGRHSCSTSSPGRAGTRAAVVAGVAGAVGRLGASGGDQHAPPKSPCLVV